MSYTYLQEQGEESSAASFSDIPVSVLSRLNLTAEKFSSNANETESCPSSQSGMMCEPSMAGRGEAELTLFAEGSRARTLAQQTSTEKELTESEADFGGKCGEWFVRFDRGTSLWRTRQRSLIEDLDVFSEIWPRSGMMRGGMCSVLGTLAPTTVEKESGYVPTPLATDGTTAGALDRTKNGKYWNLRDWYRSVIGKHISRERNANFWEWLQGWPTNWTGLNQFPTDKFRQWLDSHGTP